MRVVHLVNRLSSLYITRLASTYSTKVHKAPLLTTTGFKNAFWVGYIKSADAQSMVVETPNNLKEGEVRQVQVGDSAKESILVINYKNKIYSLQSQCVHQKFPLSKGLLIGDKLICPLHCAGFDIETGFAEQGPAFEGLRTFAVSIQGENIHVTLPRIQWNLPSVRQGLGKDNVDTKQKVVIVGAGPTALSAINSLRDSGFKGQITMVSNDNYLPFDVTYLSKNMSGQLPGPIRSSQNFANDGVIFKGGSGVKKINYSEKKVVLENGETIEYTKLLLASGCRNKYPPIQGLKQVEYFGIRTIEDYQKINKALRKDGVKNITIIGGGFIGMETASAIKQQFKDKLNISVIEKLENPHEHIVGKDIGKVMKNLAVKNGIKMITGTGVKSIKSKNGKPQAVVIQNGQIPTDILIVATGVQPNNQYASQLVDSSNNGIKTNAYFETEQSDVYAAGDIASYPDWLTGKYHRIEHYTEAVYQGSVAALNIAGKKYKMDNVPFFWTRQFKNSLVVTGFIQGWDDIHITGSLEEMKFVAYFIDSANDTVLGIGLMNIFHQTQIVNEAMKNGVMPKASLIKSGKVDWHEVVKDIEKKNPKCSKCKCYQ